MLRFMDDQGSEFEIFEGRVVAVVMGIQTDGAEYGPERANIWSRLFEANLRLHLRRKSTATRLSSPISKTAS